MHTFYAHLYIFLQIFQFCFNLGICFNLDILVLILFHLGNATFFFFLKHLKHKKVELFVKCVSNRGVNLHLLLDLDLVTIQIQIN